MYLAITQTCSDQDIDANLERADTLCATASGQHAKFLVLPENIACFAQGAQQKTAERFDELVKAFSGMARRHKLWLVAGTLPCPYRPNGQVIKDGRVRSASLLFDPGGSIVARYDKIHLFDAMVEDNVGQYQESATFEPGNEIVVADTEVGKLGMMVCYDLRFSEHSIALRHLDADIITAPSAFTQATGNLHWELLIRSRALDSQCLVLGAAQAGIHGDRRTFGHAMAANALGEVIYQTSSTNEQVGLVDFSINQQNEYRQQLCTHHHRLQSISFDLGV